MGGDGPDGLGSGDGVFGLDCHAGQPAFCQLCLHPFSDPPRDVSGDRVCGGLAGLPGADGAVGACGAVVVRGRIAAADRGADPRRGQGRQRCAALVVHRTHWLSAL